MFTSSTIITSGTIACEVVPSVIAYSTIQAGMWMLTPGGIYINVHCCRYGISCHIGKVRVMCSGIKGLVGLLKEGR